MSDKLFAINIAALNDAPFIETATPDSQSMPGWFADIAQSNGIPLWFKGLNRRYTFVNESYAALLGMKPGELLGQCDDDLLAPEAARRSRERDRSALEYDEILEEEALIQAVDGQPLWARTVQRRLMSRGMPSGLVGWWLKPHAGQRDSWAARERHLLSQFGQATNELRTPLGAMVGMVQRITNTPNLTARQVSTLASVESCGKHLLSLTNDVVDISRACAGKLKLLPVKVDLPQMLDDIAEWVRPRVEAKRISFHVHPFEVPEQMAGKRVLVDPFRLRQLLLNVLSCAISHTEDGHVELRAKVEVPRTAPTSGRTAGARLHFDIEDTGKGLSALLLAQVSGRSGSNAGAEEFGELDGGLGLLIGGRLARAMGGELHVSSEPGRGTRCRFEIDALMCVD